MHCICECVNEGNQCRCQNPAETMHYTLFQLSIPPEDFNIWYPDMSDIDRTLAADIYYLHLPCNICNRQYECEVTCTRQKFPG
jgi:hypothetical protein